MGIYQYQSIESVTNQYQPFVNYLSEKLPEHHIELRVLNGKELRVAVRNKQINLLFVNPNLYEIIRSENEITGITATVQRVYHNQKLSSLGGVIFTQKDNENIQTLQDLTASRIAIPSKNNTGAYRVPLYEVYKAGIDYKNLNFIESGDNDSVVEAVLSGKADVGFVRTGILEDWELSGRIDTNQFKILNPQLPHSFPQKLSTKLVPEWPFIILPGLDDDLIRDITVALFSLRSDHLAAKHAGISGFIAPLNYLPFEQILRELKLPPYDIPTTVSPIEIWQQHRLSILLVLFSTLLFLALFIISESRRRMIAQQESRLEMQSKIDQALLDLPIFSEKHSETEVMQYAMEQIENLTSSSISFIHLFDDKSQNIELVAWSHKTLQNYCHVENYESHYPLDSAGVWADAARHKKVIVINNYAAYQGKKGLPEGHAKLERMISVPVIEQGKVVVLAGIGNKDTDYTDLDIDTCQLILDATWRLVKEKRVSTLIHQQKNDYQRLLDDIGENYMVFSHNGSEGILTYVSAGFEEVFEQPITNVLNTPWFQKIDWDNESINKGLNSVTEILQNTVSSNSFTLRFTTPNGKSKIIHVQQHGVFSQNGLISIDGLVKDITLEVEADARLRQSAIVFDSANDGILITDRNNTIVRANKRVEEITGYSEKELLGEKPSIFSSGHHNQNFYQNMWKQLLANHSWGGEVWNRRKNGEVYPERLKISLVSNEHNQPEYFIAMMADITNEKEHQKQLERMAHYDALTNLPNRFLLSDRISQALASSIRTNQLISIMFIDLDGFKKVNDNYGHQAGDFLLKTIAKRISESVRESDTVARIGGDEFVVVASGDKTYEDFEAIEQRLLNDCAIPVIYENHSLKVSSSIGVVYYGHQYGSEQGSEQLIRFADQAMYQAKKQGKNKIHHHTWDKLEGKRELEQALTEQALVLYYQPKVNCRNGDIISLEGLIRWIHPTKGVISPAEFLPKFEQFGLMDQLSDYVLHQGAGYLTSLNKQGHNIGISINIDGSSLLHQGFINKLSQLLVEFPLISANQITLEILESSALQDVQRIATQIRYFKQQGFLFSIDDFGTGHASLNYLKNLPVNELKIDQEFIREIFKEPNSLSIIEAIRSMAEAFNLSVVAEGAETNEHIELLLQVGVEQIQGYAISKPMKATEVNQWLETWKLADHWPKLANIDEKQRQLLKARLTHLAWFSQVEDVVNDSLALEDFTTLSYTNCPFAQWLEKIGRYILNTNELTQVETLHQEVHSLTSQIIHSKSINDQSQAITQLKLLKQQCDALSTILKEVY